MQHDNVVDRGGEVCSQNICDPVATFVILLNLTEKFNFDLLTPSPGSGAVWGGLSAKYLLQCCCIRDLSDLICNITMF